MELQCLNFVIIATIATSAISGDTVSATIRRNEPVSFSLVDTMVATSSSIYYIPVARNTIQKDYMT